MELDRIKSRIDKNRDLINRVVTSDEEPSFKKIMITRLSKENEKLIEKT